MSRPDPAFAATAWWARSGSQGDNAGLSGAEAARRLVEHGPNRVDTAPGHSLPRELLRRLADPLLLVLLGAAALSAATGALGDFFVILAIVAIGLVLEFVQQHRASRAVERLRATLALRCRVLRDGQRVTLDVAALVPGDLVELAAGDRIPADGVLVEGNHVFVNQSLLTGESAPVAKEPGAPKDDAADLAAATQALFMGTSMVGGAARMRVVATGKDTVFAGIAQGLTRQGPRKAFEQLTQRFGLLILRLTSALVLFVVLVNAVWGRPLLPSLLFAVALAVGLTPELLPMVVSVTLARGAVRLARQRVLVKRLAAIHDFGAMDVLATDKTGTLTEARIRLERCLDAEGRDSDDVLRWAALNSRFETGLTSPLDAAVLERAGAPDEAWRKLDEVPFDFERRRVSVLLEHACSGERWLVVKGAAVEVSALCATVQRAGSERALDDDARAALAERRRALEGDGCRTLAVAVRRVDADHVHARLEDETQMRFVGFAAFSDPPRADAAAALGELARSGVAVKIVTGDSEHVTQHLCRGIGVAVDGVLTGPEIAALDDGALAARVDAVNLFCRVDPTQKARIIGALRARGHVVGYLGDGINDAPPLHAADVGISVDSAVDVARESADLVLLERSLHVLHAGVLEGRRTVGNLAKYLMMGMSSNFGNMLSMAAAALVLPFLPLLPSQILLNNLLYDLSQTAIPLDRVDSEAQRRPRRIDMRFLVRFMAVFGLLSSLFDALTFAALLLLLQADEVLFRSGWFVESLLTQVLVIFVIRTRRRPWRSPPARALTLAALGVAALALLLPFSPLAHWFALEPLPARYLLLLGVLVPAYLVLAELAKRWFFRRFGQHAAGGPGHSGSARARAAASP